MRLVQAIVGLLLLVVTACSTVPSPARPSVYVMRHLQKAAGPDPALSAEGQGYAQRLVGRFSDDPPSAIYVSATRRARETAVPLAARLGIVPKIYDPANTPALVARVKAEGGTVLVVGHSNTVPEIIGLLGGTRPADIAESQFGDIWHVHGARPRTDHTNILTGK